MVRCLCLLLGLASAALHEISAPSWFGGQEPLLPMGTQAQAESAGPDKMTSRALHADGLSLLYSLLGGFCAGAYPVPIKAPSVLKVNPHPLIFQCYKVFWVFVAGWLFVLYRLIESRQPVFEFSWWGTVSAAAWIPSGLCAIKAVQLIGVGMTVAVSAGSASVLSFLVFWLVLGESMKTHNIDGHEVYFAPIYLSCIIAGMVVMVVSPGASDAASSAASWRTVAGLLLAFLAGALSAVQFGAVNLGKTAAQQAAGCGADVSKCPAVFKEQFNNFGSWMASFGVGSALLTSAVVAGFFLQAKAQKRALPELHARKMCMPGSLAGLLWVLGYVFQTAAVVRGGNAVMLPANQAIQLVTSGAFGLLYYKDGAMT